MRAHRSAVFALVAFTLGALPAAAQDAKAVEVTPYVALGSAGASPVGATVTFPVTSTLGVETEVAYRRGEGRIHALSSSASLLGFLPRVGQSTPYSPRELGCRNTGRPFSPPTVLRSAPSQPGHDGERWRRPEDAHE